MTTLAALRKIRRLLAKPERWTKGCSARDKHGEKVLAVDAAATCWCLLGAADCVMRISSGEPSAIVALGMALPPADRFGGWVGLSVYNDAPRRTHAQILRLIDRAIEREVSR